MNLLSVFCGCMIPIIFAGVVFISEFHKFWMSWDMRYVGLSWITIWRAKRAYKQGRYRDYKVILYGENVVAAQEEFERRRLQS
jgi:hypothetical protein